MPLSSSLAHSVQGWHHSEGHCDPWSPGCLPHLPTIKSPFTSLQVILCCGEMLWDCVNDLSHVRPQPASLSLRSQSRLSRQHSGGRWVTVAPSSPLCTVVSAVWKSVLRQQTCCSSIHPFTVDLSVGPRLLLIPLVGSCYHHYLFCCLSDPRFGQ